jgi:hypothetical protein
MKKVFLLFILFVTSTFLFADWVDISGNSSQELFDHVSYGIGSTRVNFALDGYEIETIDVEGIEYKKISYWNEGEFIEIGKPALPRFSRLIAIPDAGKVEFDIIYTEEEIISNVNIFPRQNLQSESQPADNEFVIDEAFYNSGDVFPGRVVEIGEPAIMRDFRIVNVTINPFQYDPRTKELRIVKNVDIIVNTNGTNGENIKQGNKKLSRFFESVYQSTILNYESVNTREDGFQQPCYLFICPNDATIVATLSALVDWKHQKGFEVHVQEFASGTSFYTIKNFIQTAYDTWENPPEFICIVGDAGGSYNIPTDHMGYGEGDQGYVRLEGGDILADAFIGRLSIASNFNLQTIIFKILNYEKIPYMSQTAWYNKALLVGDPTTSSGISPKYTKQAIKEMINYTHPDMNCIEVYSGSFVSQMTSNLNSGVSYFNYRGYWGMSGWNNSYTNSLSNGFMMPFVVSLTCGTGDFEGTADCISEAFLKAGSPGAPKGAIGAICTATLSTHTCFNNCVDAGIFYGIFTDGIYHMGGALNRGKLNLYLNYPQNPANSVYNFSYWNNLMGDPGLELWTSIPQDMVVNYNTQVAVGTNYLEVMVEDVNGLLLENAWVTALMGSDDIFATGYTNAEGMIILPVNAQTPGSVKLTVTKHNYIPHLGNFDIGNAERFVNVFEVNIDDDTSGSSAGNGDGIVNPGENIELGVSLKNFGTSTVNSVTATIFTQDDFITITDATEDYGNIAPGASVYSSDDFDFSVDNNVLGGTEIKLDILIEDALANQWTDVIYILVEGANLYAIDYTVIGDPNGILDPGETVELEVTLENIGTVAVNGISGILSSPNNYIVIDDADGYFGDISAGGQASNSSNRFIVTANAQVIPGSQFTLELELNNAQGYNNTISFPINIGTVSITDPVGPDAYGYYCYDDGDIDYYNVPVYDWVEINPALGGSGTNLNIYAGGNTGDVEDITNLPITFRFYGEEYNSLTVCSNGWIAPGHTDMASFMNWNIPGPLGPSPMIAPFWDDLLVTSGDVFWYYDNAQHYVVIEWDHAQNEYNNAEETFQVLLYDSNYYPTSTGDSEIKVQYKVVNNVDLGNYGSGYVNHGQYATVGIEDHSGTIGLEYTFNNSYPTAAKSLQNEMALLFTGPPIPFEEPFLVLGGLIINDSNGNGQIDYAEDIGLGVTLNNLGENPATGITATISTTDPYITLTQDTSNYNTISGGSSGTNITDFELTIAEVCPDGHIAFFEIAVTSNEDNWDLNFTLLLNAPEIGLVSVFVNDGQNNILDPGETVELLVSYENAGGSAGYNVESLISSSDPYITLNSVNYSFGTFSSGAIATAIYNVTASASAPVGHIILVEWEITGDFSYANNGEFGIAISQIPVMIEEHFNIFPPTGWTTTSTSGQINWGGYNSNNAGGTAPEARFYWTPSTTAVQRMITMPINTIGSSTLDLEFKHYISDFSGGYYIRLETTSDGTNWNTVQSWPAANLPATTENIIIDNDDVGSTSFQLAWVFDGNSYNINYWYVDDVYIESGTPQNMGYLEGEVTLSGGTGNIQEVEIVAGSFMTHPDESGDYLIPLAPGTYDVTASLAGYETITANDVSIVANQTTTVDFELTYLEIPVNLSATAISNDVTLEWEMPEITDTSRQTLEPRKAAFKTDRVRQRNPETNENIDSSTRSLTGFKVYRNGVEIAEITDPGTMTYYDEFLNAGDYSYYITAIYDGFNESLPSNTEEIIIILAPPTQLSASSQPPDIVLDWVAPEEGRNLTGYKVYRDGEEIVEVIDVTYTDENVPNGNYTYYVTAVYGSYESEPSNEVTLEHTEVNLNIIPLTTYLKGNHPNPFNPETSINFALSSASKTVIQIYNIKGKKVRTLLNEHLDSGHHSVIWNGTDENDRSVASGIYFYKFKTDNFNKTKKMLLLK